MLFSVCPDLPVSESPVEMNSNVYPILSICISISTTLTAALMPAPLMWTCGRALDLAIGTSTYLPHPVNLGGIQSLL